MSRKYLPVPMPDKKITFKTGKNGTQYAYYTVRAYRNKNGKPTSDEVAIGKKDPITGQLIPNRRYFDIFHDASPVLESKVVADRVQSVGTTTALLELANKAGLVKILEERFPAKWNKLLACAFYMICEGNVMMYIEDWFDETRVDFTSRMNDAECSRLFASITYEERVAFFRSWVSYRGEREYIVYDVSSVSTYSGNIDIAEWGYNRDGEKLPQINLGMYYGATSHMPVYYNLYSGSIPDKTYLKFMMTSARDLGITDVCFVMDRGFVTKDNFQFVKEKGYTFVTAMPLHQPSARKLIDENGNEVRTSSNHIAQSNTFGLKLEASLYGMELHAHIYYDTAKQVADENDLFSRINKLREELKKMRKPKTVAKKYKTYFTVSTNEDGALSFEMKNDEVDALLKRTGFFILLSSKADLCSAEVLRIYREKDALEKNFDSFKNELDFRRMRTHYTRTMEGKMFVGFLALILRSYMQRIVKKDPLTKRLSIDKILIELRKIRSVTHSDLSKSLIPLTKQQRTILSVLDVPLQSLTDGQNGIL